MMTCACFISPIDSLHEVGGQPLVAPVLAHPRVDEVLVDRGQLGAEHVLQDLDDVLVSLHGLLRGAEPRRAVILVRLPMRGKDERSETEAS